MGWMVQGSNPGGDEVSRTRPDCQRGPHSRLLCMGAGSSPGVKQPGRSINHSLPPTAKVKERVKFYVYSPSGPSWPVLYFTLLSGRRFIFSRILCTIWIRLFLASEISSHRCVSKVYLRHLSCTGVLISP